jgi:Leucine-rich repeat (LRR) protein
MAICYNTQYFRGDCKLVGNYHLRTFLVSRSLKLSFVTFQKQLPENSILSMTEERVLQKIQEAKNYRLNKLDLTSNNLTEIPPEVFELTWLESLNLWNNHITKIPESISQLSNLYWLNLSGNQIATVPESINHLSNLFNLDLSGNKLTEFPESITRIPNLVKLNLSGNQLATIPESISHLWNLYELCLSGNQLVYIPESIFHLSHLSELYLLDNKLTNIPESIIHLDNLLGLDVRSNHLEIPPQEVAEQGIHAIREYFRQRQAENESYTKEETQRLAQEDFMSESVTSSNTNTKFLLTSNYLLLKLLKAIHQEMQEYRFSLQKPKYEYIYARFYYNHMSASWEKVIIEGAIQDSREIQSVAAVCNELGQKGWKLIETSQTNSQEMLYLFERTSHSEENIAQKMEEQQKLYEQIERYLQKLIENHLILDDKSTENE